MSLSSRTFTEVYKNSPNKSHDEPSFWASKHNQPKIKTNISTDSIHSSAGSEVKQIKEANKDQRNAFRTPTERETMKNSLALLVLTITNGWTNH